MEWKLFDFFALWEVSHYEFLLSNPKKFIFSNWHLFLDFKVNFVELLLIDRKGRRSLLLTLKPTLRFFDDPALTLFVFRYDPVCVFLHKQLLYWQFQTKQPGLQNVIFMEHVEDTLDGSLSDRQQRYVLFAWLKYCFNNLLTLFQLQFLCHFMAYGAFALP